MSTDGMVQVEYLGGKMGNFPVRGQVTKKRYEFSARHPKMYVFAEDVEGIIARTDMRLAAEESIEQQVAPAIVTERQVLPFAIPGQQPAQQPAQEPVLSNPGQPPQSPASAPPATTETAPAGAAPLDGIDPYEGEYTQPVLKALTRTRLEEVAMIVGVENARDTTVFSNKDKLVTVIMTIREGYNAMRNVG